MGFSRRDLSQDRFLGGRLVLSQPRKGYRAGVDPVFLAASIDARQGQSVLDLGCGAGAAALCLGMRVGGLRLVGVERQAEYAELARENAKANGIALHVHACDLATLPATLKAESFDHVIMNPPYHLRTRSTISADPGREAALFEDTPLAVWIDAATKRLKPGGYLTIVQKAERLQEILAAMDERLGSVLVKPLAPREGRAAVLVLVRARKGGRAAFRLASPLVLHSGAQHECDEDSYIPQVASVLRDGDVLPMD